MLPLLPFAVWHRPFAVTRRPAASSGGTDDGPKRQCGLSERSNAARRRPRRHSRKRDSHAEGQFGAYLVPTVGASTRPHFACKLIAFSLFHVLSWCHGAGGVSGTKRRAALEHRISANPPICSPQPSSTSAAERAPSSSRPWPRRRVGLQGAPQVAKASTHAGLRRVGAGS
jgi:hypothetical protein